MITLLRKRSILLSWTMKCKNGMHFWAIYIAWFINKLRLTICFFSWVLNYGNGDPIHPSADQGGKLQLQKWENKWLPVFKHCFSQGNAFSLFIFFVQGHDWIISLNEGFTVEMEHSNAPSFSLCSLSRLQIMFYVNSTVLRWSC